ncbi:hypothetical protein EMQ25_05415 [Arsenicitalea aurantiaca]|uniref:Uncharacterized protein n=1 Tax=Arsenicitalea aurantiaca TaxID=1783274 RepID=A0A433XER6_9HYPH|nr:hypothetical protein [Arsenicitalea aurantiaca]RUT32591.1 hypothetical protein EMQ25_05415 [Arsenicitalea aurantiaca]
MPLPAAAALLSSLLLVGLAGFQLVLALGAPYGAWAWGGRHEGALPERLRLGSALSAPLLLGMAIILGIRGGILYPQWQLAMLPAAWIVFLFLITSAFANLRSASPRERRTMGPLSLVLAGLALIVAWG